MRTGQVSATWVEMVRAGAATLSILTATMLASVIGCANAPATAHDAGSQLGDSAAPVEPSVFGDRSSKELFGVDHVPQFEFTMPADVWADLQAHARDEQYVRAAATFDGQPAGTIGLRFKGNYGTLLNCFDPTGKLTCAKLSFKVSFEEYDATNRFFGLKRVNLHSMINDPTKLHERIAYELYQLSGVQAPRSTWANVKVNGQSHGLFSLVEEIDGRFTADRWPGAGDGNLYKEAWPSSGDASSYKQSLVTNKTNGDVTAMVSFGEELRTAPEADLPNVLAKWTDPEYLNRYLAVDDAIVNCDGITAFYAPSATSNMVGNHNFYWYQEQERPYFWLVPWDMDASMTTCSFFSAVPWWTTTPTNCDQNFVVWGSAWVKPPGCDRVFRAARPNHAGYAAAVDQLLAGPFSLATLMPKIDAWSDFIRASVVADPNIGGESPWASAVTRLRKTLPTLRQRLVAVRDGIPIQPVNLSLTVPNDFERASATDVALGLDALANPGTDVSVALGVTDPLLGQQDLRLDFAYRDAPGPRGWEQWIYFPLGLEGGAHDLTAVKTIRMRIAADRARSVRIDLESGTYQAGNQGIKFGWDVPVSVTPTTIDLIVDASTLPSWGMTTDVLATVRKSITGLAFNPTPIGRNGAGFLGAGQSDTGFVRIDDVQFLSTP